MRKLDDAMANGLSAPAKAKGLSERGRSVLAAWVFSISTPWLAVAIFVLADSKLSFASAFGVIVLGFFAAVLLARLGTALTLRLLLRRAMGRLKAAADEGDAVATRAAADAVKTFVPPALQDFARAIDGLALEAEERWGDCLATTTAIDVSKVGPADKLVFDDRRARALVHVGRAEEGLAIANAVVDQARRSADPRLARYVATLGVAQLHTGDPGSALASLDEGAAGAKSAFARERAAFHRGEALRALGRIEDARAAYERAIEVRSEGSWGRRARDRLSTLEAQPYRE